MSYFKKLSQYEAIPQGLNQVFQHRYILNNKKDIDLVQKKIDGEYTNSTIKLLEWLYKKTFATYDMIRTFCSITGLFIKGGKVNETELKAHLEQLRDDYAINTFYLSSEEQPSIVPIAPDDAQLFFCPAQGIVPLLRAYSDVPVYGDDEAAVCRSSVMIGRTLCATQWSLNVLSAVKDKLIYFRSSPEYIIRSNGKTKGLITGADFQIVKNGETRFFIVDAIRESDSPDYIREQADNVNTLLGTKSYLKYYPDATSVPTYILVADTETTLKSLPQDFGAKKVKPWYTLDSLLNKDLTKEKSFLVYDEEAEVFKPTTAKIFTE